MSSLKGVSVTTCAIKNEKETPITSHLISKLFFYFIHLSLHDLASHCWGGSAPIFGNVPIPASSLWKGILTTCLTKETQTPSKATSREEMMGTYLGGLEDLTWRYSSVLPGWEDSLPGFPEPANLELEECRIARVLCPLPVQQLVQVTPARTLLLGLGRRMPSTLQVSQWVSAFPCILAFRII